LCSVSLGPIVFLAELFRVKPGVAIVWPFADEYILSWAFGMWERTGAGSWLKLPLGKTFRGGMIGCFGFYNTGFIFSTYGG
jgi:hypothetical protein